MINRDFLKDIKSICNVEFKEIENKQNLIYHYTSASYEYSKSVYDDINKALRPLKIKRLNFEISDDDYDKEKNKLDKSIKRTSDKNTFTFKTYASSFERYNFLTYETIYDFIVEKIINSDILITKPIDTNKYKHLHLTKLETLDSNFRNILNNINYYNNMYVYRNNPSLNFSINPTLIFGEDLHELYMHVISSEYKKANFIFDKNLDRKSVIVTIPNNQISEGINVIIDEKNKAFLYSQTKNFDYNYYEMPII
jgi:hypothetical protein